MENKAPFTSKVDNRFEALFNSASMAIIVVDSKGVIAMANNYANTLFAYTEESMVGQVLEKLIPQRHHAKHVGHREGYIEKPNARTSKTSASNSANSCPRCKSAARIGATSNLIAGGPVTSAP